MIGGMYEMIFALHILGAIATGIIGSYALVILYRGEQTYRMAAISLGIAACFEIMTGTLLSIISARITASVVCERLIVYLALVAIVEGLLCIRMRGISVAFPVGTVVSPIAGSLALLGAAFAMGF